ncbi:MAG: glycosyltransferase family 2 protein [Saprospiraceae bacterium]
MNKIVYIVIPAKDEATRIGKVIRDAFHFGYNNVVVVNDGSSDKTRQVAETAGATVLNHVINLGAGAATQTGIEYAIEEGADIIVTMDADNQHYSSDIDCLVNTVVNEKVDVVIGSRFLNKENEIPGHRRIYNRIGNWMTGVLFGLFVTDSQSGMKAFTADFARQAELRFNGYEFCTEFIRLISENQATYREVPIKVLYTEETLAKGQSLQNGFKMAVNLLRYFF